MNLPQQHLFSSKASQLLAWGHWFTFANIALALLISLSYLFADPLPSSALGLGYMVITWLSHTSFIVFLAFVLTVFPLSLVFPYPRHIRGMAALIATLGMVVLTLDAYVYFNLGYHLNFNSLPEIISLLWQSLHQQTWVNTLVATAIVLGILIYQLVVSNYTWHHLVQLKRRRFARYATTVIVICFALSHSIHIWADANLEFDITKQDNVLPLSYPTTAKSLLAKNDLLDLEQYNQAKKTALSRKKVNYITPDTLPSCPNAIEQPVDIVIFSHQAQLNAFVKSQPDLQPQPRFLHPTNQTDMLFNLIYGLPAYYNASINEQKLSPAWQRAPLSLSLQGVTPFSFIQNNSNPLLRIYQNELPKEARPNARVFAFVFTPQANSVTQMSTLWSNDKTISRYSGIIQPQDIIATVISQYWQCPEITEQLLLAKNLHQNHDQVGVNYSQGVFIAYHKDRITLLNADGSYKNESAAQGFAVKQGLDIPFLVKSIKYLKRFSTKQ